MSDRSSDFRPIDRSRHELLIVDDDPTSRYVTARLLRSAGFRTREAATGAEGLRMADADISAVVLDVHLPDIDGFEICRRWRSQPETVRLPVLHVSAAYVTDEDKVRGLDSGADAYLTHPVEPAVLIATVQALVRTHVAEEAMRRSEAKFRAIYTEAPGGICLLDTEGRFVEVNPAMLGLLKRTSEEVVGAPIRDFVPPGWTARADLFARRQRPEETRTEFPLVDAEGHEIAFEWSISSLAEPGISMVQATDISQRVALEQQRREALDREKGARWAAEHLNHMKDEFIAVLSHELRSPLNAIAAWTYVLQKRSTDAEAQRGLAAIDRNTKAQARLISDLLDMSRINLGKLELAVESVQVSDAVDAAIGALRPAIEDRRVQVRLDIEAGLPRIQADAGRLQQIVWNLLSNAVKFSEPDGVVEIRLRAERDGISLAVTDRGRGIAPEFAPHLFDKFSQADTASNRQHGGLGLGLSIARHLVEAHGGTISATSAGLERGSTFEVRLPLEAPEAAERRRAADAPPAASALAGTSVLVVDDDPEACALLDVILAGLGAQVWQAYSADEAYATLKTRTPDVLVCDVGMPGRDGYALIGEIRQGEPPGARLPAIALTSFARDEDRDRALAAGFDRHSPKPIHPPELAAQIQELLRPPPAA
ncbi:MAG: response regulator [Proteobacteria bacterium]|nr:response regulator [Pseudomonadota bacterium]